MNIVFNFELFCVFLANSIVEVQNLREDFAEFYNTNKYKFYERAKRSKYYNHNNMSEQTLESEVEMRRVYGILLYAEEDESVREFVYNKLLSTDRCFEELVKNPNRTNVHEFVVRMGKYKAKTHRGTNAPMFFLAYLFYVKLGLDTDNRAVKGYLERTHELFLDIATRKEEYLNIIHEREPDGIVLPKKCALISILQEKM